MNVYGFLFSGYRLSTWYYELWNTVRKALFTGMGIMLTPLGPAMQAWGALMLLIVFLVLFVRAQPYMEPWLNRLERQALMTDATTLFFGLALFLNATNSSDSRSEMLAVALSLSIVAINIWFGVRIVRCFAKNSSYKLACAAWTTKICSRLRSGKSTSDTNFQVTNPLQQGSNDLSMMPSPACTFTNPMRTSGPELAVPEKQDGGLELVSKKKVHGERSKMENQSRAEFADGRSSGSSRSSKWAV